MRYRCGPSRAVPVAVERVGPRCSSSSLAPLPGRLPSAPLAPPWRLRASQGASLAPPQGTTTPRVPPRAPSGLILGCPRPNASRRALKREGQ